MIEPIRGTQTEPIRANQRHSQEALRSIQILSTAVHIFLGKQTDLQTLRVIAPRSIGAEREAKGVCLGRLSPAVGLLQHEAAL